MKEKIFKTGYFLLLSALIHLDGAGQDKRIQYPRFLLNKYFGVDVGYINYFPPTQKLEPGNIAQTIRLPHPGINIVLGHEFNKNFSAEINYMRPFDWILYRNVNGDQQQHSVWTNVLGLSMVANLHPIHKLSINVKGGLGYITQTGFKINNQVIVSDQNYVDFLFGAGLQYNINKKWAVTANALSPTSTKKNTGPYKMFYSAGFKYSIRKLPQAKSNIAPDKNNFIFPKNLIQIGYATNTFGYGVNAFAEKAYIFWGGDAEIKNGIMVQYQHNIFHTRKVFSFSWGCSFSYWKSKQQHDGFFTVSVFPVLRFTVVHSKQADFYLNYSVAGPSYISKITIDDHDTGNHFTFQDYLGIGMFAGKKRKFNSEIRIAHYSNGDLVPQNGGIKIPLTFNVGCSF